MDSWWGLPCANASARTQKLSDCTGAENATSILVQAAARFPL
jgi:hypothetical protein